MMARRRITRLAVLAMLAALMLPASEHHGLVKFGGLPVPGAIVTVTQGDKKLSSVTDAQGAYLFPDLADGTWALEIEMPGFSTIRQEIAVAPQAPSPEWELKMLPLDQIQAVTPTPAAAPAPAAAAPETKTAAAPAKPPKRRKAGPVGPTNTTGAFQRADLNAANPNTAAPSPANDNAATNGDAGNLSQRAADGLLINGTTNNGASSPFALAQAFGNNRRGPRSLYTGALGFIMDNSALDATPYSVTGQNTGKPGYNNFRGVAAFGGPLKIPGLLPRNGPQFFFNYQWTRNRNDSTLPGVVPDAYQRSGDFSHAVNAFGQPLQIINPITGTPFAGNQIPASMISPQAQALLNLYPLPNFTGGLYNYQVSTVGITHQDALQTRMNKVIGRRNQVSGLFAMMSSRADNPNLFGFLDINRSLGLNFNLNWRHNVTQRFFTNLGFQYSRMSLRARPYFENRANISGEAGILGNNQEPVNWGPPALQFSSGLTGLTDGLPSFTRNQTAGVSLDNLWNRGRHNVSFGGNVRRQQINLLSQQDPRGQFTFTGAAAGFDVADFLLGVPDTSSIAFGNADKYFRAGSYDAYVVDDWRMSPGLTLNLGVRWEYWSPITEKYGRLVNLDIAGPFAAEAPVVASNPTGSLTGTRYPDSLMQPDKHAFQPRVGFSWRPFPASSMVVRGGYGVYYNTSVYLPIATQMAQQAPLSKSLVVPNSTNNPLTLANGFNVSPTVTPNTFGVDPNFRIGYEQDWQLSVQRDLPGSLVVTGMYQGSKGTRGMQEFLPNTYPPIALGGVNPCPACPSGFVYLASNGNSSREAGVLQLRRRLRSGLAASLQYTYSKSIDDDALLGGGGQLGLAASPNNQNPGGTQGNSGGAAPTGGGAAPGSPPAAPAAPAAVAQNWLNLRAERSLSNFDQRHALSLQMQYTTGLGLHGGTLVNGWRGALFKQWTGATLITAGSGLPLTPVYLAPAGGSGVTGFVRPQVTGAPVYAPPSGLFLNPQAFAPPPAGQWGNAGRNSITGPAQFVLGASLGRTFQVSDRFSLDLRVDATNALNHVTFPSWNTTVGGALFGLPPYANPMRSMQTTLRLRF